MSRLIVVANRTPSEGPPAAGGLATALMPVVAEREGLWFGWSGKLNRDPSNARIREIQGISVAVLDLTKKDYDEYYAGFSNSVLWPSFHLRPDLADITAPLLEGYMRVNALFADQLLRHIRPDDLIWVHDYHLIPLAQELRARGVTNRIGFFLHIPFPTPDALATVPGHVELINSLCAYDLVGLQAERDVVALHEYISLHETTGNSDVDVAGLSGLRVEVFPIGSDPSAFAEMAESEEAQKTCEAVAATLAGRDLIIGVDRLDYTKGLPQRIAAFDRLLESHPEHRRKVNMLQIAPPSRDTIAEYQEISDELDRATGSVLGRFAEPDWAPINYVKRAYPQAALAGLFRLAKVCLVTPLRDGMNLVAHEFVACQDPEDPGVLVLSRFAGAAEIFPDALLVNPYDADETAQAIDRALSMPLDERRTLWRSHLAAAEECHINRWAEHFLDSLATGGKPIPAGEAGDGFLARTGS